MNSKIRMPKSPAVLLAGVLMALSLVMAAHAAGGGGNPPIWISGLTVKLEEGGEAFQGEYIARDQTFYVIATTYDNDPKDDPQYRKDVISSAVWERRKETPPSGWTEWAEQSGSTLTDTGDRMYETILTQCITEEGKYEFRVKVDDLPQYEPDPEKTSGTKQVEILSVDYVTITCDAAAENGKVYVGVGKSVVLQGHAYNNGDNATSPDDDIEVGATFEWTVDPALGTFSLNNGASTTFTAGQTPGACTVKATHPGSGKYVEITVCVVKIDLTGVNFDEVQNVPINGKLPVAKDGFNDVGRVKVKILIDGAYDTSVEVVLSDTSSKLEFAEFQTVWIGTDPNGHAEEMAEIYAVGTTPSGSLEDITLRAELSIKYEPELGMIADTEEKVTVYKFFFKSPPEVVDTTPAKSDDGGAGYQGYQCWTGSGASGSPCFSSMEIKTVMQILCQPAGAFEGSVKAKAKVHHPEEMCGTIWRGCVEEDGAVSLGISIGIVSASWSSGGSHDRAGFGMDQSIEFLTHGVSPQDHGDWTHNSEQVPLPLIYDYNSKTWVHTDGMTRTDELRVYEVGGDGYDVWLGICIAAKTSRPPGGYGVGCSVDSESNISTDVLDVEITEEDDVYEIQ
jgi:hypothetical protein